MRTISASRETEVQLKLAKQKKKEIVSFFPLDKHDCPCQKAIIEYQEETQVMPKDLLKKKLIADTKLTCPRHKAGMKQYNIICNNCGALQGTIWSSDEKLSDWCDFHYYLVTDGQKWTGCFTPHISPIDETLCFECTCGNDTRDFRANTKLPSVQAYIKEQENSRGRAFGTPYSKFRLQLVKK